MIIISTLLTYYKTTQIIKQSITPNLSLFCDTHLVIKFMINNSLIIKNNYYNYSQVIASMF